MNVADTPRRLGFAVALLTALVYANTLVNGFTFDDISIVQTNPYITDWRRIPWLFTKGYWSHKTGGGGNYRPLSLVTFTLEYAAWGLWAAGYHLTNTLLHTANVILLFHLLRCYRATPGVAGVTALVFAVHPIHTEAVANVVGRSELLGLTFGGLMWWAWIKSRRVKQTFVWRAAAAAAYLAALLSKENMVVLPAALWLAEAIRTRRQRQRYGDRAAQYRHLWRLTAPFWVFAAALAPYFWLRASAGEGVAQTSGVGIVPLAGYTVGQRALIMLEVGLVWYRLLFIGYPLRPWYDETNISVTLDWNQPKMLGLLITGGLIVAAWLCRRRAPLVAFAVGFWFITLTVVSNVPIPLGALIGERWLYVPSVGYAVAVGYGVWLLWKQTPRLEAACLRAGRRLRAEVVRLCLGVCLVAVVGSYTYRTVQRNLDWRDNYTLFSRFIETDPRHPLGYVNVGDAIVRSQPAQARVFYEKALQLEPRSISANIMLTTLDIDAGAFATAQERLARMLTKEPPGLPLPSNEWGLIHALYAQALAGLGETEQARREAQTALRYAPDAPQSLLATGEALVMAGERAAAIEVYRRLTTLLPKAGRPRARLGVLLLEAGDATAAERELTIAAQLLPDSPLVKNWLEKARHQAAARP
ncbi:MAG: hypothetical protein NZ585_06250 [Chloracidobacterium sp.]|nr:hypothetical protein [Chloracidobacterium sp.]MDW8216097.1 hypothetical protein [Acidobacteriota bacterium]